MDDSIKRINLNLDETQRNLRYVTEQMSKAKTEEIARQERNNELLEINAEQNDRLIRLKETELEFLENISGDAAKLVSILSNLEMVNRTNGTITEANMLLIQQRLDQIIANSGPANINQLFLEEAKKQIVEQGVGFGLQFIITGLKHLFKVNSGG